MAVVNYSVVDEAEENRLVNSNGSALTCQNKLVTAHKSESGDLWLWQRGNFKAAPLWNYMIYVKDQQHWSRYITQSPKTPSACLYMQVYTDLPSLISLYNFTFIGYYYLLTLEALSWAEQVLWYFTPAYRTKWLALHQKIVRMVSTYAATWSPNYIFIDGVRLIVKGTRKVVKCCRHGGKR